MADDVQMAVLAAWKQADWNAIILSMNETMASHKAQRDESKEARKALSETTKQFKRSVKNTEQAATNSNDGTLRSSVDNLAKECKNTIKAYQEEIDNLTRRCKAAESSFAATGMALAELPDPVAVIQQMMQENHLQQQHIQKLQGKMSDLEDENSKLKEQNVEIQKQVVDNINNTNNSNALSIKEREELIQLRTEVAEYEVEFRSLKNQDITIRKLEAKIEELQTAGAETIQYSIAQAKEELALTEGRRVAEALEREAAMERKVQSLEIQLKSERAARDATQYHLLEADEGAKRLEAAWEAQRQILVDDNERLREQYQQILKERDELFFKGGGDRSVGENSSLRTPPPSGGLSRQDFLLERSAYEAEVSELSETNAILREELRSREAAQEKENRELQNKIDELEREKVALSAKLTKLQNQLASAPSQTLVESMQRELRILKRLEYNDGADDADQVNNPEMAGQDTDLETVLVTKLRRVESELVTERTKKTELAKERDSLKKSLQEAERVNQEANKLVASLEKDLERAIQTPAMSKQSSMESLPLLNSDSNTLQTILDPDAPSQSAQSTAQAASAPTSASKGKPNEDHSVATIVMAQRDRLRSRCETLEAERDSFKRELQSQVQMSESLKSDNAKLYEKVRYLQNYANTKSATRGNRDLDLEALEQRYEASVDPFKQFSKAERQRKVREMSPMERTVFIVAKTVLSTKEMRTGLFFYVVTLHLLIFATTYHWSHSGECPYYQDNEHLAHLPPALPAHIQSQIIAKDAAADAAAAAAQSP